MSAPATCRVESTVSTEPGDSWWDHAEWAWWHSLMLKVLKLNGPLPRHVAFVMDGNRRYARCNQMGSVLRGHECGFKQLTKILEWCSRFGVVEVTVYAFSIENFKRSPEEVNGLMELAEQKFALLLEDRERLEEKQIRFRFLGNTSLLSPKLRLLVAKIELETSHFENGTVNVCMPYSSTDEMARAVEAIRQGRQLGLIQEKQISEWLISRCLDTADSSDPDLLIRTSGERRLSDFLLWQANKTHLYFDPVLWPDFSFSNLCRAVHSYQYNYISVQKMAASVSPPEPAEEEKAALQPFLSWHRDNRVKLLEEYSKWKESEEEDTVDSNTRIE